MPRRQIEIYSASNSVQANLLKDHLEQQGIAAVVVNEALDAGFGRSIGMAPGPKVLVDEPDAELAREIVQAFDDQAASSIGVRSTSEAARGSPDIFPWPLCPGCGAPRHTTCRICGTAGSDFPIADNELSPDVGDGRPLDRGSVLLICSTCDEPFAPEYLRRCQWCGHDFGEGLSTDIVPDEADSFDAPNLRVVVVGLGLVGTIVLLAIYFAMIADR